MKSLKKIDRKKITLAILAMALIVGSFLRLQGVFTNSFAFTYDVGRDMLALRDMYYLHKIPLIGATTGLPGIFYGPWWYYLLFPFFIIVGGDPQGIAFIMAVIGILSIPLGYLVGKKISGNMLGLTFATFISVSPYLIALSSQIWNPNIAPFFVLVVLYVLTEIYKEKNASDSFIWYFLLGLLLALNIDLEIVFGTLFCTSIIASVLFVRRIKIALRNIFAFLLGVLIIFSPRIIFEFRHSFLMTNSLIRFLTIHDGTSSLGILPTFMNRVEIFLDIFSQTTISGQMLLGVILFIASVVGFLVCYKKLQISERNFLSTAFITIAIFLIGTTFFSHDIWPHYLVGLPIIFLLSVSMVLVSASEITKDKPILIVTSILIFLIQLNPVNIINTLSKPVFAGDASVYRNQVAVIDYVYRAAAGKQFKYVVYTPPVHDYTYQYLFEWYGQKKYKYEPAEKSKLAFFILEPDPENPKRLTDWLAARVGDGHIILTKDVKAGIVVQTRTNL